MNAITPITPGMPINSGACLDEQPQGIAPRRMSLAEMQEAIAAFHAIVENRASRLGSPVEAILYCNDPLPSKLAVMIWDGGAPRTLYKGPILLDSAIRAMEAEAVRQEQRRQDMRRADAHAAALGRTLGLEPEVPAIAAE